MNLRCFVRTSLLLLVASYGFSQTAHKAREVVLVERTGCLGSCPSYQLEIHADGRIVWTGNADVAVTGRATSRVDPSLVATAFSSLFGTADREICIDEDGIDAPVYFILFSRTGDLVSVERERKALLQRRQTDASVNEPCSLGANFTPAVTQLEKLADSHRWVHGEESLEEPDKISADIYFGTKRGFSQLMRAAGRGDLDQVKSLGSRESVDVADSSGWTALMVASSRCRLDVITLLLSLGADPNLQDLNGDSALTAAATAYCGVLDSDERAQGRVSLVKQLVGAGAPVNSMNRRGQTALMVAARFGNDDAVKALLDLGANADARDASGMDAIACAKKYQSNVAQYNSDYQAEYRERFQRVIFLLSQAHAH